tara:strand:- start:18337 stop:20061 length:1725 start_codon:yes stop_codon:yes gene_type:complete
MTDTTTEQSGGNVSKSRGNKTRELFLEGLAEHGTISKACMIAGVTRSAYDKWRQRIPEFSERADSIREKALSNSGEENWDGSFQSFRSKYFGNLSPWFHIKAIEAYEHTPPGNITMILWPPEHGKTTLAEDYFCYKLATNPQFRITVGSEGQDMARKILGRIRSRMEPQGPFPRYVAKFGPFVPQNQSGRKTAQPWGADYFSVYKKSRHDERDYSMVSLGWRSKIAGTRTDHLHIDDIQSRVSLNLTEQMFEIFRQDWLTRPGENGRTSINGTRVGEDDFYERIMDGIGEDILKVIRFPAIITNDEGEPEPLWPEMFSLEQLDRIRRKVGEEAWSRNYMQQPSSSATATFTDQAIQKCMNPLRSVNNEPPEGCSIYIGLDPALGSNNCVIAATPHEGKLKILFIREDTGLTRNEQILGIVEDTILNCGRNGSSVSDVVIEAMVFQKGLSRDQRLVEMTEKYGFRVREHLTGMNKYDEDIGVPSMALSFMRGEIEIPYADDPATRHQADQLVRQLKAWRPLKRGTKLRQDQVMALWFIWILWRQRKQSFDLDTSQFSYKGLPWGSVVPSNAAKVF